MAIEPTTFITSDRFLPLDYLRIPHRLADGTAQAQPSSAGSAPVGFASLTVDSSGQTPHLYSPRPGDGHLSHLASARAELAGIPIITRVVDRDTLARSLPDGWHAEPTETDASLSVWRHRDGSILLPFDPTEAIETLWSERYTSTAGGGSVRAAAQSLYYRVRPILPRRLQIAMRRSYARVQDRRVFPRWPIEPALHDLLRLLYGLLTEVAGGPVPWIGPWPRPYRWAVVLTHDVETDRRPGTDRAC